MAKKKVNKKATKRSRGHKSLSDKGRLHNKIRAVASDPEVKKIIASEAYGENLAKPDYFSVPAAEVFCRLGPALSRYGLTVIPVRGTTTPIQGFSHLVVLAEIYYQITDIETGYSEEAYGSGLGDNQAWGASSAQTLARKQALLSIFNISYPQPAGEREMQIREIKAQAGVALVDMTPENAAEKLGSFFEKGLKNESGNSTSTDGNQKSGGKRTGGGEKAVSKQSKRGKRR